MAEDNEEGMSDEELDALLQDLEGRSAEGGSAEIDDDEDIEAYLASLEDEVSGDSKPTKTREKPKGGKLAAELAGLDEPPDADLQTIEAESPPEKQNKTSTEQKEKKAKKKEKKQKETDSKEQADDEKAKKKDVKVVERGESRGLAIGLAVLKWSAILVPVFAAWWLLGAYLSQWVSAGWLVFGVATALVFGVPALLRHWVKRGGYAPWVAGFSLLAAVGLTAPIPHIASEALAEYGHWPASTVAEVADLAPDSFVVDANAWLGSTVGGVLDRTADPLPGAKKLGTTIGLTEAIAADDETKKGDESSGEETKGADSDGKSADDETTKPKEKPGSSGDGTGSKE